MEALLEHTRVQLLAALRRPNWTPAPLRDLWLAHSVETLRHWLRCEFADGTDWNAELHHVLIDELDRGQRRYFIDRVRALYSNLFEDELLERELRPIREEVYELQRNGAPFGQVRAAIRWYEDFERHVRRCHRNHPPIYSIPVGTGPAGPISELRLEPGSLNFVVVEDLTPVAASPPAYEEYRRRREREIHEAMFFGGGRRNPSAEELHELAEAARRNQERTREAKRRAEQLLLSWLTPAQRQQYEADKCFDVVGSTSKRRYRIRHGRQMNVFALDGRGREVQGYCFLPQGNLVEGDCMLAQKIALETDETAALKIANKFPGPDGLLNRTTDVFEGILERWPRFGDMQVRLEPGVVTTDGV